MTSALRCYFPAPSVTRTRRRSLRSSGPVRVSASVHWSLHRKGTRCDDAAVVDLSVPLRSKHFVTISDAGGASEDLALPGLLGFGRVELAFEEEEVSKKNEKGEATESVGGTKGSEQIRPRAALFVTDIGSEALVLVDGQPLAKKQKRLLRPGSVLSFRSVKGGEGDKEGEGGKEECEFELFRNEVAHA